MRKIVKTLILLWMGTLAATAQTIHVEEVTLSRGYEAEIPVSYDFKESYYGLQMDFTLPEGIFLDSCQLGQGVREAGYQLYHATPCSSRASTASSPPTCSCSPWPRVRGNC